MKNIKPGQLCTIDQVVYRARKRNIGCLGCVLNTIMKCPNISKKKGYIECSISNIILEKI